MKLPITPVPMICYSQNTPFCIPCFGKWFCAVFIQFVFTQVLPDEHARDMCLRFADMESKLGEIDRGRAIYSYCSQICDPRVREFIPSSHSVDICFKIFGYISSNFYLTFQVTANFWQTWKDFEIRHGNEDTIREMLRIKRSVQATYNTQVNFMSSQMLKATTSSTGTGRRSWINLKVCSICMCYTRYWLFDMFQYILIWLNGPYLIQILKTRPTQELT